MYICMYIYVYIYIHTAMPTYMYSSVVTRTEAAVAAEARTGASLSL